MGIPLILAEPDSRIVAMMYTVLRANNFDITGTPTLQDAGVAIASAPHALLVLRLDWPPPANALDFLRWLGQQSGHLPPAILCYSHSAEMHWRIAALQNRADDFLVLSTVTPDAFVLRLQLLHTLSQTPSWRQSLPDGG